MFDIHIVDLGRRTTSTWPQLSHNENSDAWHGVRSTPCSYSVQDKLNAMYEYSIAEVDLYS